jgi:hypothetical protein
MASPVTDPAILAQLNGQQPAAGPVTDPALLKELNSPLRSFEELGKVLKSGSKRFTELPKAEQEIVARGERNPVSDKVRGFVRGVPFIGAFSDEINARLMAATGGLTGSKAQTYDQRVEDNLAYERTLDSTFDQDNPIQSLGSKVAGGVVGTIAAAPAAAASGALNVGGRLLLGTGAKTLPGAVARGATAGGLQAAAAGAGDAEGGFVERSTGAAQAAPLGTAVGGLGPLAFAGAGRAYSAVRDKIMPPATGPLDNLTPAARNYVRRDLADPAMVARQQSEISRFGDDAMLADASPEWMMIARGAAARPGRDQIVTPLLERDAGKNARIRADLDANLGPAPTPSYVERDLEQARQALSPRYTEALQGAAPVDVRPIVQALQGEARNAKGREWRGALSEVLDLIAPTVQTREGARRILDQSPEGLLNTRGAVDTIIRRMEAAAETDPKALRSVSFLRQAIDDELAAKVPGIKAVDAQFQELSRQSEGLTRGGQVLATGKTATRPNEFGDELTAAVNPEGQLVGPSGQAFRMRQGNRAELDRTIGLQANDPAALKRTVQAEGDWNRDKLRQLYGDEPADNVLGAIDREVRFDATTKRVTAGADTAAGRGFDEAIQRLEKGAGGSMPDGVTAFGFALGLGKRIVNSLASDMGAAKAERFASELGRMAVAQGPERDRFIAAMVAEGVNRTKAENLMNFATRASVAAGREAPSQLLSPVRERQN